MKFAHDLIVNQFVDRYKQVKHSGIEHFGSPKARVTASVIERRPLYTDQLYGTHMAVFSKSCSVAVVYRVTAIYRAVTYWFDYKFLFSWLLIRRLIRGNSFLI